MIPFRHVTADSCNRIIAVLSLFAFLALIRTVATYHSIDNLVATRRPVATEAKATHAKPKYVSNDSINEWGTVFAPATPKTRTLIEPLRYRLAGTFLVYGGLDDQRRAVIDDSEAGAQIIVSEGDKLSDGSQVDKIVRDAVTLLTPSGAVDLRLVFETYGAGERDDEKPHLQDGLKETDVAAARFGGQQVAENRWHFDRQKLLEYYAELRDEPARLVAVFDSMKPVYTDDNSIEGYRLIIEGEADFFSAVGLHENDIVRAVNSVDMTNRRRAEHFIREFVADRANIFVLDVERNGEIEKLIYQVQQP